MQDRKDLGEHGSKADTAPSRLVFYEDSFVFDTVSGMFYRLNPTAAFVLRAMGEGTRPDQLPELLQSHYAIEHKSAVRDAELFVNELAELGLCEEGMW
jgi:hypothetical protein